MNNIPDVPGLKMRPKPHDCKPPDMRKSIEIAERYGLLRRKTRKRTVLVAPFIIGVVFDCPVCGSHWHWSPPWAAEGPGAPGEWYRHN